MDHDCICEDNKFDPFAYLSKVTGMPAIACPLRLTNYRSVGANWPGWPQPEMRDCH